MGDLYLTIIFLSNYHFHFSNRVQDFNSGTCQQSLSIIHMVELQYHNTSVFCGLIISRGVCPDKIVDEDIV